MINHYDARNLNHSTAHEIHSRHIVVCVRNQMLSIERDARVIGDDFLLQIAAVASRRINPWPFVEFTFNLHRSRCTHVHWQFSNEIAFLSMRDKTLLGAHALSRKMLIKYFCFNF